MCITISGRRNASDLSGGSRGPEFVRIRDIGGEVVRRLGYSVTVQALFTQLKEYSYCKYYGQDEVDRFQNGSVLVPGNRVRNGNSCKGLGHCRYK